MRSRFASLHRILLLAAVAAPFMRIDAQRPIGLGPNDPSTASIKRASRPSTATWIDDVHIVSPERLDSVQLGAVLIDGGRIVRIVRGRGVEAPAGATVVSGHGGYLIPGLIDSHVHLASIPGMETPFPVGDPRHAMIDKYYAQLPRSYLYFGYTTLVDLAVYNRSVLDGVKARPLHPDVYDCGPSVPIANGYPMVYAPPNARFTLFPNFLWDSSRAASVPSRDKPEEHTPAAVVATVKRAGGVCVKTYFERGFAPLRNLPVPTLSEIAQLRDAAHRAGLPLMIHANSLEAQQFAVAVRADVMAHGMWNWNYAASPTDLPRDVRAVLDRVVARRMGYQPTVQVMAGLRANFDAAYLRSPNVAKVVPAEMLAWFRSDDGQRFRRELTVPNTPDSVMLERYERAVDADRRVVAYLAKRNAKFLFGTDTPSAPTYGNLPGLNGFLEMRQLHKAGMSLAQILRAATIDNAREFKLEGQIGTIEPGKVANLVLLHASPLASVGAYDGIITVWVHGRAVTRDSLAAQQ